MTLLLANIPLMVLFFALWAGIPMWLVTRHPDTGPETAQTSAIAYLPAKHDDPGYQQAA
jgi:hypothetical protein